MNRDEEQNYGFGLAYPKRPGIAILRVEGTPVHPDDLGDISDEQYLEQLEAYKEAFGDIGKCKREWLVDKE